MYIYYIVPCVFLTTDFNSFSYAIVFNSFTRLCSSTRWLGCEKEDLRKFRGKNE